jgi:hypothetical protein
MIVFNGGRVRSCNITSKKKALLDSIAKANGTTRNIGKMEEWKDGSIEPWENRIVEKNSCKLRATC